jgi:hypothetical protein
MSYNSSKRLNVRRYVNAVESLDAITSEWSNNDARGQSITQMSYPSLAGSPVPQSYSRSSVGYRAYKRRLKSGH